MTATLMLLSPPVATAAVWNRVTPILDRLDVPSVAVQMPSTVPGSESTDAGFLRSALDERSDDIVLVGHSNAGVVVTEVGVHPSVKHLVYLDAPLWEVGEPWDLVFDGGVEEGFVRCFRSLPDGSGLEFATEALSTYLRSRGWSEEDVAGFLPTGAPQRHDLFTNSLTVAAWQSVPSTFIWPRNSEMKRHAQEVFAARAAEVIEIEGDHFPHWRRPDEVAQILARIAREAASAQPR